ARSGWRVGCWGDRCHGCAGCPVGDLLGGRRVRGGRAVAVLADGPVGVPGGGTDGGPQAGRAAGRGVRPGVRSPVRAPCLRERGPVRVAGGLVGAVSPEALVIRMVLVAGLLGRLALTDDLLLYLRPGMRPWVLSAAAALAAVTPAALVAPPPGG